MVLMRKFSGFLLKTARENAKLSQMDLAKAIDFDVGPATIGRYEAGDAVPTFNTTIKIAAVLKVSLKDLTDAKG